MVVMAGMGAGPIIIMVIRRWVFFIGIAALWGGGMRVEVGTIGAF